MTQNLLHLVEHPHSCKACKFLSVFTHGSGMIRNILLKFFLKKFLCDGKLRSNSISICKSLRYHESKRVKIKNLKNQSSDFQFLNCIVFLLWCIFRLFFRNAFIKWVEMSVRPSVSLLFWVFFYLLSYYWTDCFETSQNDSRHKSAQSLAVFLRIPYGIFLFTLLLLSRIFPDFVRWYQALIRTITHRSISVYVI